MQLKAVEAGRRKHRKTSKRKSNRRPESVRGRQSPTSCATAGSVRALSDRPAQATPSKPALAGEPSGIESELQALKITAQMYRKPHHREAAMLVLATVGCFLIPAGAGQLLVNLQDWAFLATIALLGTWLLIRMRRYQRALELHFNKALTRINQAVGDPSERLVYRSSVAKLRAEWLAPRKFFESDSSLFAALALYVMVLLAAHAGSWMLLIAYGLYS